MQELLTHALEQNAEMSPLFTPNSEGEISFTGEDLMAEYGIDMQAMLDSVDYDGDEGLLTDDSEGNFTFWPTNDDTVEIAFDVTYSNADGTQGQFISQFELAAPMVEEEVAITESLSNAVTDYSIQPGALVLIPIPDAILSSPDVDSIKIDGLEDGVSISNALENADGSFTISGHNESFVIETSQTYTGDINLSVSGYDSMGNEVELPEQAVQLNVSDSNIGVENNAYVIEDNFIQDAPMVDIFAPQEVVLNEPLIDDPFAFDDDTANDYDSLSSTDQF